MTRSITSKVFEPEPILQNVTKLGGVLAPDSLAAENKFN